MWWTIIMNLWSVSIPKRALSRLDECVVMHVQPILQWVSCDWKNTTNGDESVLFSLPSHAPFSGLQKPFIVGGCQIGRSYLLCSLSLSFRLPWLKKKQQPQVLSALNSPQLYSGWSLRIRPMLAPFASGVSRDLQMDNRAASSNKTMKPNTPATTAKAYVSSAVIAGVLFPVMVRNIKNDKSSVEWVTVKKN